MAPGVHCVTDSFAHAREQRVFDVVLSDDQMSRIAQLDTGGTLFFDHADPEWVERLKGMRGD